VLVIDDICESGKTLSRLTNVFRELGALEVRSAVLIHRAVEGATFIPTWKAFDYLSTEWFVGYGLGDKEHNANLPDVYNIFPS
jgi:hypoxanthine-guanine phosphoribosyltransferase